MDEVLHQMTAVMFIWQCLVNILESLVLWTKTYQYSRETLMDSRDAGDKTLKDSNHVEDASDGSMVDETGQQVDSFERLKAHKSTLEAAVAEVCLY
jgi:hypothetical protein